jgi:hypothetical protein
MRPKPPPPVRVLDWKAWEEELLSSKAKRGTLMGLMQTTPCSTLETEGKGRSCAAMIGTLGKEGTRLVLEDVKVIGDKKNGL